jgi:hypothetical protein
LRPFSRRPPYPYFWKEQGRAFTASSGYPIAGPGADHEDKLPPPDKTADSIAMTDMASGKLAAPYRGASNPERMAVSPGGSSCILAEKCAHL